VDWTQAIELGFAAAGAAVLGSMLGLGGGVFLVPIFTLFFGIDPKIAVGASAVSVITNSVIGSTNHLRAGFTNLRLAMLLGTVTSTGAFVGATIAVVMNENVLGVIFGAVLLYSAISMLRRRSVPIPSAGPDTPDPHRLGGSYLDPATKRTIRYVPHRVGFGMGVSSGAGVLSGMLGVGGGVIQVPLMNLAMSIPVKAAAGTSSFLVGLTSVATATVFYADGKIDPSIVVPTMIGIIAGSQIGSHLTRRLQTQRLIVLFVVVLVYLGVSMVLDSFGISLPGQ
jgi:uncharacterized membrane protein YfcA